MSNPPDHGVIVLVGAGIGHGYSHTATQRLLDALHDGHLIIADDAETLPEFDMQHIIKLRTRDEPRITIKYNHAQEHGDTWRRKGKRKGRRGR